MEKYTDWIRTNVRLIIPFIIINALIWFADYLKMLPTYSVTKTEEKFRPYFPILSLIFLSVYAFLDVRRKELLKSK